MKKIELNMVFEENNGKLIKVISIIDENKFKASISYDNGKTLNNSLGYFYQKSLYKWSKKQFIEINKLLIDTNGAICKSLDEEQQKQIAKFILDNLLK